MAKTSVNIAVLQDGRILLTQRADVETWVLPGGGVEEGESLAEAAIRETREETGLDVKLTGLVGVYSRLGSLSSGHKILFAASPVGGRITCQEGETIAVEWFSADNLPSTLGPGQARRIADSLAGVRGIVVSQHIRVPSMLGKGSLKELMASQEASGLKRQELLNEYLQSLKLDEIIEIEPEYASSEGQ